jgi:hypothetical protein
MVVVISCIYALYYERIMMAEEAFLRQQFGETFEKWASQTPAFIPKFRGWKCSPVSFCWRTVAQREYNAFFSLSQSFFCWTQSAIPSPKDGSKSMSDGLPLLSAGLSFSPSSAR